jgi:hypothetical protein
MDPALPYQGFGEAFREYIDADAAKAKKVLGDLLPELRGLFPEIAEAASRDSQSLAAPKREDRTFTLDSRPWVRPITKPIYAVGIVEALVLTEHPSAPIQFQITGNEHAAK